MSLQGLFKGARSWVILLWGWPQFQREAFDWWRSLAIGGNLLLRDEAGDRPLNMAGGGN
jgi:hypothetical protein